MREFKTNIFEDIQKDTNTVEYQRRHSYNLSTIQVDGIAYTVFSALPITDIDYQPESVADKINYLIAGK